MNIYISGPMTGKPDLNEPLFRSTEERLRELGHTVFNPHNVQLQPSYRDYLAVDLAWICENADALVVLPGWTDSPGSRVEGALADAIGIPRFTMSQLMLAAAPTEPVTNMHGDGGTMAEDFGR